MNAAESAAAVACEPGWLMWVELVCAMPSPPFFSS
jgi:hypothetical protein